MNYATCFANILIIHHLKREIAKVQPALIFNMLSKPVCRKSMISLYVFHCISKLSIKELKRSALMRPQNVVSTTASKTARVFNFAESSFWINLSFLHVFEYRLLVLMNIFSHVHVNFSKFPKISIKPNATYKSACTHTCSRFLKAPSTSSYFDLQTLKQLRT